MFKFSFNPLACLSSFFSNIFLFLSISLFLNGFILSQSIQKMEFNGAENFTPAEYRNWIKIADGSKYFTGIEDSIRKRIGTELISKGYYNYTFEKIESGIIDSSQIKITIVINEGLPTIIRDIIYNKASIDSTFLEYEFLQLRGNIFSREIIERSINDVLTGFENRGFPFASIRIESVYFVNESGSENPLVDLYMAIDPGRESRISRIELSGNSKTKADVIVRAIGLKPGDLYIQNNIDEIAVRLNRLRFFEPVDPPEFYFNSADEGILKIIIKEKETNNFDGIIGYIPAANQNEKGFITGFINVNLRNLFGTGRSAAFKWQQENRYSQELEIRYLEPWLFDFPVNIEAGLFQRKQDSTYVQRSAEGKIEYAATDEISASVIFNTQSTIPSERVNKSFTVYNSTSFTAGLNVRIDTRDDPYAPVSGILLSNSYKYTSKSINGPKEYITPDVKTGIGFQRLEIDLNYILQIFRDQVISASVHARELKGDEVEISDLYLLGGTNTLRGYREKQFAGNRILWSNLEYRYLLSRRSFAFLFLDTGYFLRNEDFLKNIPRISEFKYGYGIGFNIETALGILGVSFALGEGDSFGEGKIHFGIINEF